MKTLLPAFVSGLLLALSACGGGSLSPSEAFDEAIKATCSKAFECMSSYPSNSTTTFEQLYGTSESACISTYNGFAASVKTQIQASIDAGRITYNADDAQTCLDAEAGITCGQFWGTETNPDIPACDTAFQGTVADGGMCTIDDDCSSSASACDSTTKTCGPA